MTNNLNTEEFKPTVLELKALGLTVMMLEDTQITFQPWGPYKGHAVDLGYNSEGKLVAIQIWDNVGTKV